MSKIYGIPAEKIYEVLLDFMLKKTEESLHRDFFGAAMRTRTAEIRHLRRRQRA